MVQFGGIPDLLLSLARGNSEIDWLEVKSGTCRANIRDFVEHLE